MAAVEENSPPSQSEDATADTSHPSDEESTAELRKAVSQWPMFPHHDEVPPDIKLAVRFGAKGENVILVTRADEVLAVGANTGHLVSVGDGAPRTVLSRVAELCGQGVVDIVVGETRALALTAGGQAYEWNINSSPQLVHISEKITEVACGKDHSVALGEQGQVFTWGSSAHGQLGYGTMVQANPQSLSYSLPKISAIGCTSNSTFALSTEAQLFAWGLNNQGQLGNGGINNQSSPVMVGSHMNIAFKSIACGCNHVLAISDGGRVYAWGANDQGQLGLGTRSQMTYPVQVDIANMRVVDIGATNTSDLSVAMTVDGHVFFWGDWRGIPVLSPRATSYCSVSEAFLSLSSMEVTCKLLRPAQNSIGSETTDGDHSDATIMHCLERHFDNEEVSDVRFVVEEKTLHGHLSFLRMRSSYLRSLLSANWTHKQKEVKVTGQTYKIFRAYLKYLYTCELDIEPQDAIQMLQLADEYCEASLKGACEKFALRNLSVDNVFSMYSAAKRFNARALEDHCFNFAADNLTEVIESDAYRQMDKDVTHDFFIKAATAGIFKH